MAAAQHSDQDLQTFQTSTSTTLKFTEIPLAGTDVKLICDISTGKQRPYVPLEFRHEVFTLLQSLAHPRIRATQHLLTNNYFGPASTRMFETGLASAFNVGETKSTDTQSHLSPPSQPRTHDSIMCTLILLDLSPPREDTPTS